MKRMIANVVALAAAAVLAGLGVATATVGGAETVATATAAPARYEYPADVQAARKACFRAEREARGIPGGAAYVAWYEANRGTAAGNAWDAAYEGCKAAHNVAGTRWSAEWYGNLVQVG